MKKLLIVTGILSTLTLTGCNITYTQDDLFNRGAPAEIGKHNGQPIYYQEVFEPRYNGRRGLFIVPGAVVSYENHCGKGCSEMITTAPVLPSPKEQALAKLTPEDKEALGL